MSLAMVGTVGADVLSGTSADDSLSGLAGDDLLYGLSGNDVLDGGTGADTMYGGLGADTYEVDESGDRVAELDPALAKLTLVSVDQQGLPMTLASDAPSLSANGRLALFRLRVPAAGAEFSNATRDLWLHDVSTGVSGNSVNALPGAADVHDPVLSADGRIVGLRSAELTPLGMTTLGWQQALVHDRLTGGVELVSVTVDGRAGDGTSSGLRLSADGRYVGFLSTASNLVSGQTYGLQRAYLRDRQAQQTQLVSVSSAGLAADLSIDGVDVSADGQVIVFDTASTNLVAGDTNGLGDVFVRDLRTGQTSRVSVSAAGAQGNDVSAHSRISGNGRYVIFTSGASNLIDDDTNGRWDLFWKDLVTGQVLRVSESADGAGGNDHSWDGSLSADGRFVVFGSHASNLVAHDSNAVADVFVKDMATGAIVNVSRTLMGDLGNAMAWSNAVQTASGTSFSIYGTPSLSADGSTIAFVSQASNLGMPDANGGLSDVFLVANPLWVDPDRDTVRASISYTLPDRVEALVLTGSADLDGTGNALDNTLTGNAGNNRLDGAAGMDTLLGGAGDDLYRVGVTFAHGWLPSVMFDAVIEQPNEGVDTVQTDVLDYTLPEHVERLVQLTGSIIGTGNAGDNVLIGHAGENWQYGLGGNDRLDGGAGTDLLFGGDGDDTYLVDDINDRVTETEHAGTDTVVTSVRWMLGDHVERLILAPGYSSAYEGQGNALDNVLIGNEFANYLNGGAGNDILDGGAGDDYLVPGDGNDVLRGGEGNDDYVIYQITGNHRIEEIGGPLSLSRMQWVSFEIGDISYARDGDDLVMQARRHEPVSADVLPSDRAIIQTVRVVNQFADRAQGLDSLMFIASGTTLLRADLLALAEAPAATDGADLMAGSSSGDVMFGLGGNDIYVVNHVRDQPMERAGGGYDTVQASLNFTLPAQLEALTLTGQAGLAGTGNELANQIYGNDGSNWLSGEDGNDTIRGGAGNDDVRGGNGGDLLYGEDGDDLIDGGAGADLMNGGAGDDRYTVSEAGDVIEEVAEGGIDTVLAQGDYVLYANLENLELLSGAVNGSGNSGSNWLVGNAASNWLGGGAGGDSIFGRDGNDALHGDDGNDVLHGEAGDDLLDGGAGDNQLIGGAGNDRYLIRSLGDQILEDTDGGIDTAEVYVDNYVPFANVENVTLAAGVLSASGSSADNWMEGNAGDNFLGGGLGHDALFGFAGNDYLKGDDGDDRLEGGAGDDILEGNFGVDTLMGGDGNDTYYVDGPGDVIVETASGGIDTVYSSGFYTLSGNLENLVIIGEQAVDGTGDAGSNWMRGNAHANGLNGGAGDDTILGGGGADTLRGGQGNDMLDGQDGGDSYVYQLGDGQDQISDDDATAGVIDTLDLSGIARSLLAFARNGDNLVVNVNDLAQPGSVTVLNWFAGERYQLESMVDADGARAASVISALAAASASQPPAIGLPEYGLVPNIALLMAV